MTDRELMQQALEASASPTCNQALQVAARQALEAMKTIRPWEVVDYDPLEAAITALRAALAEQPAEQQEPVAWRNAAIRVGEELSSVGPDGYYDMTANQWLDWAMAQEPRGKTSLNAPPASKPWVGLTDKEYQELHLQMGAVYFYQDYGRAIEAKLREKNT